MERQGTAELTNDADGKDSKTLPVWGKLTSVNCLTMNNLTLSEEKTTIGRNSANIIVIADKRLSGLHCQIIRDKGTSEVKIEDLSTNGTWLNDQKLGKGKISQLKNGDEIYILHHSKVDRQDLENGNGNGKRKAEEPVATDPDQDEKKKKLDEDLGEEMQCSICIDYIYQCITLIPCLHNFCASCYSDWMEKSKECPSCRDKVLEARKNPNVNNIIDKYLASHPEKKRPKEEYDQMNQRNKFTADKIQISVDTPKPEEKKAPAPQNNNNNNTTNRGRGRNARTRNRNAMIVSDSDESYDEDDKDDKKCPECVNPRADDHYKCKPGSNHLVCTSCNRNFPDRRPLYKQECAICKAVYCNLYFGCNGNKNRKLLELRNHHPITVLSDDLFRGNKYEANIMRNYVCVTKKMTASTLFQYLLKEQIGKDKFKYKINRSILNYNPLLNMEIALTPNSAICLDCFPNVWFQMVFRYRIEIKPELPKDIRDRPLCWWGINCKTMVHNEDHSKKMDHVCEQTRFAQGKNHQKIGFEFCKMNIVYQKDKGQYIIKVDKWNNGILIVLS